MHTCTHTHTHARTHAHTLTYTAQTDSHTQHRQIGKTWLTRYMDRSILRELCSWSSNLTNFSFWKCNTHDHELTQSGGTSCTFRKWKTVLRVPCGQHLQQTYTKHTHACIKTRQWNTILWLTNSTPTHPVHVQVICIPESIQRDSNQNVHICDPPPRNQPQVSFWVFWDVCNFENCSPCWLFWHINEDCHKRITEAVNIWSC